jgi:GNAT superfamily N-acetyltransferase
MMRVGDLRMVPQRALPPGYAVRWYQPGDEQTWLEIHRATGVYDPLPPGLFDREFGMAPGQLPGRQFFIVAHHGAPFDQAHGATVATSTAWFDPRAPAPSPGRVHWVAVVPGAQRRGLGSALVWQTCRRLAELGHVGAYLTTGADNLPAINLYLRMGFTPHPRSDQERAAWRDIYSIEN